jgi:ribosomal protein S18 acetylase RimI-like enzyme
MGTDETFRFPLVDEYLGRLLGVDLATVTPGRLAVVESPRRLRRQLTYGFVHALWWVWLEGGRSAVSVPPGAAEAVRQVAEGVESSGDLFSPHLAEQLRAPVSRALVASGLGEVDRVLHDLMFAAAAHLLRRHHHGDCRRLTDASIPAAPGLSLPEHCFPDGIAYGVVVGGWVVSVAYAHRSGVMEDRVTDLGVETAPGYRRRGYAKTAVSAVVQEITSRGGEALYMCSPENLASRATALGVGFVPCGRSLVLATKAPDLLAER